MKWYIWVCILLLSQVELNSGNRHRHRHRHHRIYTQQIVDNELLQKDVDVVKLFEDYLNTLTDGPSMKEDVEMANKNVTFPSTRDFGEMLRSPVHLLTDIPANSKVLDNLENKLVDAITRVLNFYDSQLDEIMEGDASVGLKILKDIDDKHGKVLQKKFPLDEWIEKNCERDNLPIFCKQWASQWKNRSGGKGNMEYWKSPSVLQEYINRIDENTLEHIGNEKEGLWGRLNGECQEAVVSRCEIPYICERTLLDPVPRSQYLLTHQLLQRLIIDNSDCPNLKSYVTDDDTYAQLCAKAYVEAQYLDVLDVPVMTRDLFSELVGFGGYLGYTNFLRVDWLDRILSWQSESDSGCFVEGPLYPEGILSTDMGFDRQPTKSELEQGVEKTNEKCLPHLTTVALTALTAFWDYVMDLKSHQLQVGAHSEL